MRRPGTSIRSIVSLMFLTIILVVGMGQQLLAEGNADIDKMIKQMLAGRETQTQIPYLTHTYGTFSMDKAYRIQALLTKELKETLGAVAGYKVAYASKAAQQQFGVDEPARGTLFQLQRVPSGSRLPVGAFMELLIETEIAFTVGKRIDRSVRDVEELKKCVKWVHVAFDIGDFRFVAEGAKGTVQDMVASGVGAHFFVLGPAVAPSQIDIDALTLELTLNGQTIRASAATNVMGSPWNSLLWLANNVVEHGGTLEPGAVVLTGTAAKAYRAKGNQIKGIYDGDCGPLGRVSLVIH